MSSKANLYNKLIEAWSAANSSKSKQVNQRDCNEYWNRVKTSASFESEVNEKIVQLNTITKESKGKLTAFFKSSAAKSVSNPPISLSSSVAREQSSVPSTSIATTTSESSNITPKQNEVSSNIEILKAELYGLALKDKNGMLTETESITMKKKEKELSEMEKKLSTLKSNALKQKRHRDAQKRKLEAASQSTSSDLSSKIQKRESAGRPSKVEAHPDLLSTIVKIATFGGAADDKRRSEVLRSVKTLDELKEALHDYGIDIGRSTLYYHLQPKNSRSNDGKKHVRTVPVRLIKASNNQHKDHVDAKFCASTINNLLSLASFLGPNEVSVISQDDKARVPLGITAAKEQSPILMHMEYKIRLPDHDWVVANGHKLIPSVYAALEIQSNGFGDPKAVKYSGPTYIAIRSAKHSSSTAHSHAVDFARLRKMKNFEKFIFQSNGLSKPVMIQFVDGGPDENPRYKKTVEIAIHNFIEYGFDALFIATNAPGRSAFNPVERRMAPLSRELSGVVLPYENFGSHLDNQRRTVDSQLEIENFKFAGEVLAEIFSKVIIDNHETVAEFIELQNSEIDPNELITKDEAWKMEHIRTSQYFLQIVKCHNKSCCTPHGNYLQYFPDRFLPAIIPLSYKESLEMKLQEGKSYKFTDLFQSKIYSSQKLPYDFHLPSLKGELNRRKCDQCDIYFASLELLKNHKKMHSIGRSVPKAKAKKILKKRGEEVLAIMEDGQECEWIHQEEIEGAEQACEEVNDDGQLPVVTVEDKMNILWENDE